MTACEHCVDLVRAG